jgi:hypothetical protein
LNFYLLLVLSGFSKWWESKYNISPMKFGLGLTLLGLGFDFSDGSMVLMPTQLLESVCFG